MKIYGAMALVAIAIFFVIALGIFLGPWYWLVIGVIVVIVGAAIKIAMGDGDEVTYGSKTEFDQKTCPHCAETIKAAATKCRYCQSELA